MGRSAKVQALNGKMTRKDMLIALAMTLAYLAMALFNLGSMKNPASGWIPKTAGITFHVEFEEEVNLSRITYLAGLGSDWYSVAALEVEYLDADTGYLELCLLEKPESSFMKWYAVDVEASTSTLRITSRSYENPDRNIRGTRGELSRAPPPPRRGSVHRPWLSHRARVVRRTQTVLRQTGRPCRLRPSALRLAAATGPAGSRPDPP
ncbi:MAG: hypothetical protein R6W96_05335, partial [Clostridia bacterium]